MQVLDAGVVLPLLERAILVPAHIDPRAAASKPTLRTADSVRVASPRLNPPTQSHSPLHRGPDLSPAVTRSIRPWQ
jgi:hypothetical protein